MHHVSPDKAGCIPDCCGLLPTVIISMDQSWPWTAISLSCTPDGPDLLHRVCYVQMLERVEQRQKEMEASMQEQRQQLQAEQDDLASWKADAQRQLDMQQVCFDACALSAMEKPVYGTTGISAHFWHSQPALYW